MDDKQENKAVAKATKLCTQCKSEIPVSAKRCSHCGADLRSWPNRHPFITVATFLVVIFIFLIILGASSNPTPTQQISIPTSSSQSAPTTQQTVALNQNKPTIKQLSAIPSDYVGQSFVLDVNVETANYYNYGFQDDAAYYAIKIWDDSVDGEYDGIYAYLPKNAVNKQLVNGLLSASEKLEVNASVPADHWQSNSNAFLYISSWKLLQ